LAHKIGPQGYIDDACFTGVHFQQVEGEGVPQPTDETDVNKILQAIASPRSQVTSAQLTGVQHRHPLELPSRRLPEVTVSGSARTSLEEPPGTERDDPQHDRGPRDAGQRHVLAGAGSAERAHDPRHQTAVDQLPDRAQRAVPGASGVRSTTDDAAASLKCVSSSCPRSIFVTAPQRYYRPPSS